MGDGRSSCGREPGEAARRCREAAREVASCPCALWSAGLLSPFGEARSSLCSLPGISPGHHVQTRCHLLARCESGAESPATWRLAGARLVQAFRCLAPIRSPRLSPKRGDLGFPSLLYPSSTASPAYPVGPYRSSWAAAARCRSCVGREAVARLRPGDSRAACGKLGLCAPLRELLAAACETTVLPSATGPAREGWQQTTPSSREGKALRQVFSVPALVFVGSLQSCPVLGMFCALRNWTLAAWVCSSFVFSSWP